MLCSPQSLSGQKNQIFHSYPQVADTSQFAKDVLELSRQHPSSKQAEFSTSTNFDKVQILLYEKIKIEGIEPIAFVVELSALHAVTDSIVNRQFYFDGQGHFLVESELQEFQLLHINVFEGVVFGGLASSHERDEQLEYGIYRWEDGDLKLLWPAFKKGACNAYLKIYDAYADVDLNQPALLGLEVLDENGDGREDLIFSGRKLMNSTKLDAKEYAIQFPVKFVFHCDSNNVFRQKVNYEQLLCRELEYQELAKFHHRIQMKNKHLVVDFWGEVKEVKFAFYQGPSYTLSKVVEANPSRVSSTNVESSSEAPVFDVTLDRRAGNLSHFSTEILLPEAASANFQFTFEISASTTSGQVEKLLYRPEQGKKFQWTGPSAPLFQEATVLKGALIDTIIESHFLGQERQVSVYLPPAYESIQEDLPVVYMTDGKMLREMSSRFDRLIASGGVRPFVVVGVFAGTEEVEELRPGFFLKSRQFEYVDNGLDRGYFKKHQDFFLQEVLAFAENNFRVSNKSNERYLYGSSNGAAFCVQTGINYPELWEEIIAFSAVDYINETFQKIEFKKQEYPSFYLSAGRFEDRIMDDHLQFVGRLKEEGIRFQFRELLSGHDSFAWEHALLLYLSNEFAVPD